MFADSISTRKRKEGCAPEAPVGGSTAEPEGHHDAEAVGGEAKRTRRHGRFWQPSTGGRSRGTRADVLQERFRRMFEQALEGRVDLTDIWLEVEGGWRMRAHKGVLCAASERLDHVLRRTPEGRLPTLVIPNCSRRTMLAFVEYLYVGDVSAARLSGADGGQLWRLAEEYQCLGLLEFLESTIDAQSICAATQSGLEAGSHSLVCACVDRRVPLDSIRTDELRFIGAQAVWCVMGGRASGLSGLEFVERWWKCNRGFASAEKDAKQLARFIDLTDIPTEALEAKVRGSWLVEPAAVDKLLASRALGGRGWAKHTSFTDAPSGVDDLVEPVGVAAFPDGNYVVVEGGDRCRVTEYTPEGSAVRSYGAHGAGEGEFEEPAGVAVNGEDGLVYVTDRALQRVVCFLRDGTYAFAFGGRAPFLEGLVRPSGVAVNEEGEVLVCDEEGFRVQVYGPEGCYRQSILMPALVGSLPGVPYSVAVSPLDGKVVVRCDHAVEGGVVVSRAHVLTPHGMLLGSMGQGLLESSAGGVAVSDGGDVVCMDLARGQAVCFDAAGNLIRELGGGKAGDVPEFDHPTALALTSYGAVLVAEGKRGCVRRIISSAQ